MPPWSETSELCGVKLLSRNEHGCVFLIGKREKQMMFSLLQYYPMLGGAELSEHPASPARDPDHEALLREALLEQQRQNRKTLDELLGASGRFAEDELGFRFSLTPAEGEWLLQVFNDIRVGSWVKLGSPEMSSALALPLTEEKVKLCWAMEIAGLFESELLQALQGSE